MRSPTGADNGVSLCKPALSANAVDLLPKDEPPYADLSFSDEEVMTIYLFGIIDKIRSVKKIYGYAARHLRAWFPKLPSYVAFVQRLNRLADVFAP